MKQTPDAPRTPEQTDPFYDIEKIASSTECTGLTPAAVLSEEEAEAYAELYAIHRQRPADVEERSTGGGQFSAKKRRDH